MSFLSVLIFIPLLLALCELLAGRYPRMQQQIYYIALIAVAVWCTAKYAYGPDIVNYIPFYRKLTNPVYDWHHLDKFYFETGFVLFCSTLKWMGCTFWGMTAVISVLYFIALALVLRELPTYRTTALLVIVFLDNNLILSEFRQCLAVSFFFFFILLWRKKHYIWSIVPLLLCIVMHKSAIMIAACAAAFYFLRGINPQRIGYVLLALLIIGLLALPLMPLLESAVQKFSLMPSAQESLMHHMGVGKLFQRVFLLYIFTILLLAYYKQSDAIDSKRHWLMWCCMAVIVCLYPYWFLLNRLRSYFLPFLVVYIIRTLRQENITDVLPRQLYTLFLFTYIALFLVNIPRNNALLQYPTDNISLVFERREHSAAELEKRQIRQARLYWKYDYKRLINSGIQK